MTLKDLEIGKSAVITSVGGKGALRQHFLDMGMIPGAEVTVVKFAPMGADRNRTDSEAKQKSRRNRGGKRPGTSGTWRGWKVSFQRR